jgi:hypothetical protein
MPFRAHSGASLRAPRRKGVTTDRPNQTLAQSQPTQVVGVKVKAEVKWDVLPNWSELVLPVRRTRRLTGAASV